MDRKPDNHPVFGELIHSYTRADALADGTLVDVSAVAREAGIRYPVALTRAVWAACVRVPEGIACQDEAGRCWDVVWMLRGAMGRNNARLMRNTQGIEHRRRALQRLPVGLASH